MPVEQIIRSSKTTTQTITTVSTSFVCCQTSTVSVTPAPITTTESSVTTVTETPKISGTDTAITDTETTAQTYNIFSASVDCVMTISVSTAYVVAYAKTTVYLQWYGVNGEEIGNVIIADSSTVDANGFTTTISAASASIVVLTTSASLDIGISFTATSICPS